jgi:prefoldin subunit 5
MRLKLKSDEQEKSLADKHNKIKELQSQISLLQQKEVDNGYLRDDISKKEATIKMLDDKIRSLTRSMDDMRELATDRSNEEGSRLRELQLSVESLKSKLESK